jgi:hypothetical protein
VGSGGGVPVHHGAVAALLPGRLLTKGDPAVLAENIAAAVERDARHVRTPRRAVMLNLLSEAPRRMTELLLTGVPFRGDAPTSTAPTAPTP